MQKPILFFREFARKIRPFIIPLSAIYVIYTNNAVRKIHLQESKTVSIELRECRVNAPANCDAFPADVFDPNIMLCWGNGNINSII